MEIEKRAHIAGEVWISDHDGLPFVVTDEMEYIDLVNGGVYGLGSNAEYSAPSVEAYYARKALCPATGNSDSDISVNLVELAKLK